MSKIHIEISGPQHSKKTTAAELLARTLSKCGVTVCVQKADPQFSEKQAMTDEELASALAGTEVVITEMQTR